MVAITYIEEGGVEHHVDVPAGATVMNGAQRHAIPGIVGDCGGACCCGVCHVYIEEGWYERLPPMQANEEQMLDFAMNVQPNSRLSCQIKIDESMDGLVVRAVAD